MYHQRNMFKVVIGALDTYHRRVCSRCLTNFRMARVSAILTASCAGAVRNLPSNSSGLPLAANAFKRARPSRHPLRGCVCFSMKLGNFTFLLFIPLLLIIPSHCPCPRRPPRPHPFRHSSLSFPISSSPNSWSYRYTSKHLAHVSFHHRLL